MVVANQAFNPELTISATLLLNLGDGSSLAIPTMTYTPLDWLQCSISAQIPTSIWGTGGEFKPSSESLIWEQGDNRVDFSALIPDATITFWTRASY